MDSAQFASKTECDAKRIVGIIKSLAASNMVIFSETDKSKVNLTEEAMSFIESGSPEARAFEHVKKQGGNGVPYQSLKKLEKTISEVGFKQAMQQKWLAMDKAAQFSRQRSGRDNGCVPKIFKTDQRRKKEDVPKKELDVLIKKESWQRWRRGRNTW